MNHGWKCGDRIDGWWNQNPPRDSQASLGRERKRFRFNRDEGESSATRKMYVSLDNADNVIEGGPAFEVELWGAPSLRIVQVWGFCFSDSHRTAAIAPSRIFVREFRGVDFDANALLFVRNFLKRPDVIGGAFFQLLVS
jgi:hypothetical protein